jgi:transcription-repair coupling factor (superfamily II helicase)
MDRLVIGDVGFGKTEVALRAAFKAVMSGKQVAVLAPTTVLVQQHFGTFCERLATFPVNVQMLSRFKSRREQPQILEGLASGEVDIVIGTHRLLSSDVRFRDLGLLIIDEEHRFGVKHKERLKQLRQEVDVLTLTATPIPRTLHMAMTGLRDMSTIESPPEARLPVITHVGPYEERMVQHAIRREIGRGGQVFFVHHRVQGIEMIADRLSRLIPEAQVSVAHGQMDEQSLAASMLNFAAGTTNVLVCTSIVESGLDIAGANTLIVDRADQFGLAQLYQLRGRVGRGPVQAYAYLFYAAQFRPVAEALKRLETMAEARELGAGFRIAMQDLELRGAGDILGARQHGHIAAIGFDLYTRLLAESIKRLRADERSLQLQDPADLRVTLPTVDLPLDAYLPEEYVPESYDRTRLYRRMAVLDDLGELERLESEFRDRFGRLPEVVANLMVILRLRILAHRAGAATIGREGRDITVLWPEAERLPARELRARLGQGARIGKHQAWLSGPSSDSQWLQRLEHLLLAVRGVRTGRRETHPSGEAA